MPAVASVPKELYLSSSLKDLNKKTEVKPEKISTKNYVQSALKIFKTAEESRLDRDEERAYVLYMKYVTVYNLIKKGLISSNSRTTFFQYLDLETSKKLLKKLKDSLKALNSDMKKLKFGKNLKKKTDRRKSSCRDRKGRKQELRMVAHQQKVLWKVYWIPKTKPER